MTGENPDATAPAEVANGTADERRAAARALAGNPAAAGRLGRALEAEMDPRVREAIFTSLVQTGGAEGVAALLPHLGSDDAGLRVGALDALKAISAEVRDHLPELLAAADPDVRILGCELVRCMADRGAVDRLCRLIDAEGEINVCAAAIDVLAEIGTADIADRLVACAARFAGQPFLGFAVTIALRRLGAPRPPDHG